MITPRGPQRRPKFELTIIDGMLRTKIEFPIGSKVGWGVFGGGTFLALFAKLWGH